jgi:hypothetical protein
MPAWICKEHSNVSASACFVCGHPVAAYEDLWTALQYQGPADGVMQSSVSSKQFNKHCTHGDQDTISACLWIGQMLESN